MGMDSKITEIYSPNPLSVSPDTSIKESISIMRNNRISCLLVTDAGRPVGIYTEMDMVRTLNQGINYETTPIKTLMSQPVLTAGMDTNAFEASYILTKHNIRHLAITDQQGQLAGIVTQTDIINKLGIEYFMGVKSINSVMNKNILSVEKDTDLNIAVAKMECFSAGCILVEEDHKPIGILTERDMASLIMSDIQLSTLTMADVMSSPVVTVRSDISAYRAIEMMNLHKMRRLIVVDENEQIMGILLQENIIREMEGNYIHFLKKILLDRDESITKTQIEFRAKSLHLENILRSSIDQGIVATDLHLNITYFNPEAERIYNRLMCEVVGQPLKQIFSTDVINSIRLDQLHKIIQQQGELTFSHTQQCDNGERIIESRITGIKTEDNTQLGYTLISHDVTEKLIAKEKLTLASHVYENAIEGIMVTDASGTIQSVNPAFSKITGYNEAEVLGNNPRLMQSNRQPPEFYQKMWDTILATGSWQGEIWNRRKNGETYPQRLTISSVKDAAGKVSQYIGVFYDITKIKAHEDEIRHLAYHDPLTELPNRLLFQDRLSQAILHARRKGTGLTLMFLDIDHFKKLNDTLGHLSGDLFLQKISAKFKSCLRDDDTVSRLGGDEFTILLEDIECIEGASKVARKILALFDAPFELDNNEIYLGTSIGIARYPSNGDDAETLTRNADTAMYHAKAEGRNNFQFFETEMETRIKQRVSLETDLRKALSNDEFLIYYQPIIDLSNPGNITFEALLRWNKPNASLVSPATFIPLAEDTGLIIPIGNWVLTKACHQVACWNNQHNNKISISINLSARQFRDKELLNNIKAILDESGLEPSSLNLEITESVMMEDMKQSITTLNEFKDMGIKIYMDDFGTGYSSFIYLKKFPIDALKLDHTFMHDVAHNDDSAHLVAGIISIAKGLDIDVVAEGVESQGQVSFLKQHGCDKVQGYLYCTPMPEDEVAGFLARSKAVH